jgi:uncharacterized peroxidase-related enzyme
MPRLAPLRIDETHELSAVFRQAEAMMGFTPNDGLIMARRPDITTALMGLVAAIYAPGKVADPLKRLIAEATSKAAGCTYCVAHTAYSAHKMGVSEEKITALWEFETSPHYDEAEKAAINVAMKAGMSPNATTDEDFDRLKQHYDEEEIVEIVSVIALFGFLNRWNSTLATELEAMPAALAKSLKLAGEKDA